MLMIKDLYCSYGEKEVLKGVQLEVEKQEVCGFVGANGAGKTTMLNTIATMIKQNKGVIKINEIVQSDRYDYKSSFFYIQDSLYAFRGVTGKTWINYVLRLYNIQNEIKVNQLIEEYAMENTVHEKIESYSYGMKHKLLLIIGFTISPKLLIMDEPLNGLDPKSVVMFKKHLNKYITEEKGTVLFSTHLLDVAEKICTHVALLKNGQIIYKNRIDDVLQERSLENLYLDYDEDE